MDNMPYLVAAFMAIWLLLAFYLFLLHSREKKLRLELARLGRQLEKKRDIAMNDTVTG